MADFEKEIKKLREEAAKYRTQLAPYKKAFGNMEPDAIEWLLRSVELVTEDPSEAGKRFATLAYGNLGEYEFKQWIQDVVYDGETEVNEDEVEYEHNEDYGEEIMTDTMGGSDEMPEWAKKLEERVTGVVQAVEEQSKERQVMADRKEQFKTINDTVASLGYDVDSWQGKMVLQVASQEVDVNEDVVTRLEKASEIVKERLGDRIESQPSETVQIGAAEIKNDIEVPATGGQVGGGGIPNVNEDTPMSFGDADEALMNLMKSQVGQ